MQTSAQPKNDNLWPLAGAVGLGLLCVAIGWLIGAQGAPTVGTWIAGLGNFGAAVLLLVMLWARRSVRWAKVAFWTLVGLTAAGTIAFLFHVAGSTGWALATLAVGGMALCFIVGVTAIRLVLTPRFAPFGVARTLIEEAVRMRISLVFLVALFLLVPTLPVLLDPEELLKYRIQFFLTWSIAIVTLMMSLLTIALACTTICNEIKNRQIYLTLTKPVSTAEYLLGKWLGIMLLNALLLGICFLGVYAGTLALAQQPAKNPVDAESVQNQILVARFAVRTTPPEADALSAAMASRINELRAEDPTRFPEVLPPNIVNEIEKEVRIKWHTLPPGGSQAFGFPGVGKARAYTDMVHLEFKPKATGNVPGGELGLAFWVNDRPYPTENGEHRPIRVADNTLSVLQIPVSMADEDGNIVVRIENLMSGSVTFNPSDGLQVLYVVDTFAPNLLRGFALIWMRLGFLAILGLWAGTFLSFPIAMLVSLMVLVVASYTGYLKESLAAYTAAPPTNASAWQVLLWYPAQIFNSLAQGDFWGAIKFLIRLFGSFMVALIPSLTVSNPTGQIANGRVVPYNQVADALLWISVIWSGVLALLAWLLLRFKELAKVTV